MSRRAFWIGLVVISSSATVLFQNCSKVSFSPVPNHASLASVSGQTMEIFIEKGSRPPIELDLVLLLDDSRSNLDNFEKMIHGLEKLVTSLQQDRFNIEVHTLYDSKYSLTNQKIDTQGDITTTTQGIRGTPLSQLTWPSGNVSLTSAVQGFLHPIRDHLQKRRLANITESDSTPSYFCQLLAHFSERANAGGSEKNYAAIVLTDEDTQSANTGCIKSARSKTTNLVPPILKTYVSVDFLAKAEGGGNLWIESSAYLTEPTCATVTKTKIDETLSKLDHRYRPNSKSYTCRTDNTFTTFEWLGWTYFEGTDQLLKTQFQNLFDKVSQANFFFGGFVTTAASQISNPDQAVAVNQMQFAAENFAPSAVRFYPIASDQYSQFTNDVFAFHRATGKNYIELARIVPAEDWERLTIKALRLIEYGGQSGANRLLTFTRVGDRLIVNDADIDLGQGARIEAIYDLE